MVGKLYIKYNEMQDAAYKVGSIARSDCQNRIPPDHFIRLVRIGDCGRGYIRWTSLFLRGSDWISGRCYWLVYGRARVPRFPRRLEKNLDLPGVLLPGGDRTP